MQEKEPVIQKLISSSRQLTLNISVKAAKEYQLRTLRKLLGRARDTAFGREYGFKEILEADELYSAYRDAVPLGDYASMLPWWTQAREGKSDITWPGKIENFALSSGTSDGASKYIPVSDNMVKAIRRASLRQVFAIARSDVPKDHMTKNWLIIGGSTSLNYNGIFYSGDLSGITSSKIPSIIQRVSKPEPDIMSSTTWKEKIERITNEAPNWDVGMVAGVPAWIQLLFKNIIKQYGLKNIHDIWPNLEVYIHGGVSIKPYKSSINALLGRPIKYFETYLASEGFIAIQTRDEQDCGMRLLLRNGIFLEFVPFNNDHFDADGHMLPEAKALPIWEVEEKVDYALIISTCSGAWRYLIGDTIRFVNLKKKEIIITGRTKHYISLVGEHLSVDNMTQAMEFVAAHFGVEINEFCVAGTILNGSLGHKWYVGVNDTKVNKDQFRQILDEQLCALNDDYAVERSHALKRMEVEIMPISWFLEWMRVNGKEGSQHKFPRVMKGVTLENWQTFLLEKGIEKSEPAH